MPFDKWIAVFFLAFSIAYGWAALEYPILPFERSRPFKPNTMPQGLAVLGILFSLIIVLAPRGKSAGEDGVMGGIDFKRWREYKVGQALALIAIMVLYAVALRPAGFVASTSLFLIGGGVILGERKFHLLIPIALTGTLVVWYLVQEVLGIFLRPWPEMFGV